MLSRLWLLHALLAVATCCCVLATYDGSQFDGNLEHEIRNSPCVRLFSNAGDIGCRTPSSQSIGALHEISNSADILGLADVEADFAVLAPADLFSIELLTALESISKAKGLIIYDVEGWVPTNDGGGLFSTDVRTPQGKGTFQEGLSLGSNVPWNTFGNGAMHSSFNIPVVHASSQDEVDMLKSMSADNRKYGLSSNRVNVAEFQYYMGQHDMTSRRCLDWKDIYGNNSPQCLPIGGASVWATAGVLDERQKVVVTAGIDSTAFFHDLAYGANEAAASVAVVLAAAEAVGRSLPATLTSQPLFFLANAEEWGYAGSRRFVRDITTGISCAASVDASQSSSGLPLCTDPVYPSTLFSSLSADMISDVVAIDQVGSLSNGNLFIHSLYEDSPTAETLLGVDFGVDGYSVAASSSVGVVPPTPLTSFIKGLGSLDNKGVVISGYDTAFDDPTYHTSFDATNSSVSSEDVVAAATIVAKAVVSLCGGDVDDVAAVNETWAATVLECLVSDWNCPLMRSYVSAEKSNIEHTLRGSINIDMGTVPPNYYTGTLNAANGGLPVVQHDQFIYGKYSGDWNSERDRAFIIPNALEAFIRASFSYHLAPEIMLDEATAVKCDTASDCHNCTILNFGAVQMECFLSTCVCPTASYHLAVDPGDLIVQYY
jgi:nicastrin